MITYTISNERSFNDLLVPEQEGRWPADNTLKRAGFNPNDPELCCSRLAADWNGHPKGATVMHTLSVTGYRFVIFGRKRSRRGCYNS